MITTSQHASCKRLRDRGAILLILAVSMVFILGMAGLAIDLASLYVGRSEAQRAADAAALAGARALASDITCVNGGGGNMAPGCEALARQRAEAIGNMNLVEGVSPQIGDSDITFLSLTASNPQIQVIASRDTAHGNPMPTFFVKIFGIDTANVSAKAVAEAYTSNGTGARQGNRCVKPWLIPNCDSNYTEPTADQKNEWCTDADGNPVGDYVQPIPGSLASKPARSPDGSVLYSATSNGPSGSAIGEPIELKPGDPGSVPKPGQFLAAYIPNDSVAPTQCPSCAKDAPLNGGTGSAAIYRENIECCNQNPIVCGQNNITLASSAGNMVGPTTDGVECLIHQGNDCGQDYLSGISPACTGAADPTTVPNSIPFKILAGADHGHGVTQDTPIDATNSDSVVLLPIWDGSPLQSGQNPNLVVVGFMEVFVRYVDKSQQGTVYGTVMNVLGCGSGGSDSGTPSDTVIDGSSAAVPIRLIHLTDE